MSNYYKNVFYISHLGLKLKNLISLILCKNIQKNRFKSKIFFQISR